MKNDLKNIQWGEFLIGNIFRVSTGNIISKQILKKGKNPRITATDNNNGIFDFYKKSNHKNYRELTNFISVSFLGSVFYHPYSASLDMKIHALQLPNINLNKYLAEFLILCLKRTVSVFSYGDQLSSSDLPKKKILLPTNPKGEPDYAFMEQFIKQKEQEKTEKFQNYILKRINIIKDFKEVISLNQKEWGEFFIEDIAQIISGRDIYESERKKGNIPYVSATANNNGIGYFVGNSNDTLEENCISVNRNGSVGYAFYHEYKALFSNDCRKLRLKINSPFIAKFISTIITGQKGKYGYGYKMGTERIKRQKILLPINTQGEPDYVYMENYIKKLEYDKLTKYINIKTNLISLQ